MGSSSGQRLSQEKGGGQENEEEGRKNDKGEREKTMKKGVFLSNGRGRERKLKLQGKR